ncbi:MAG: TatD family hydrolase [Planctomycetaceae bacterium]|nr:TatD family hydrolase [Planctomycetaceae bacterium]
MTTNNVITIFDTHAHLDSNEFNVDRNLMLSHLGQPHEIDGQLIQVSGVIVPGTDLQSSRSSIEISLLGSGFYSAVGIHPNSDMRFIDKDWHEIKKLAERKEVIAIGETGLDRYKNITPIEKQIEIFCRHIELSIHVSKPILIHCRDAWDDVLPILHRYRNLTGVIHSFNGTSEQAEEVIERGFYISFAGQVTYRNEKFKTLHETAKTIPEECLLIETDSPYLIPHPFRGQLKRNEPSYAFMVAKRLAELRQSSVEHIAKITTQNAIKFINVK